jgi:site-specific DNA-methyltransferase (adenine-specific)
MTIRIIPGDCRDVLKTITDESVDSIVTDPPYHLTTGKKGGSGAASEHKDGASPYATVSRMNSAGFMGMKWDGGDVAMRVETWAEALRVLKPGGHLLAFSGTRTYHRMVCAIEDAGFEVRDQIGWLYGSGFPKSRNLDGDWQGWGTALKPAWEPIVVARKPLAGTVAANVLAHGTGALNIDGCRVATDGETFSVPQSDPAKRRGVVGDAWQAASDADRNQAAQRASIERTETLGRWPANIIHDGSDEVVAAFPQAGGALAPVSGKEPTGSGFSQGRPPSDRRDGGGSAARFFYTAKASAHDRHEGLLHPGPQFSHGSTLRDAENVGARRGGNHHPTVKPTDLMRYLCRLVTPPGGTVLDPFAGSGSTLKAAELEGFSAIGIELDPAYIEIAKRRIAADMPLFAEVTT